MKKRDSEETEKLEETKEFIRLKNKTGIEILWLYILSILTKKELHAYALRKEIEKKFGFGIGEVTTYIILYKLESRGFVESRQVGFRKIYKITNRGKNLLEMAKSFLKKRFLSI
ncbi:MAG: PadR family transcriptional regulator [Candidatus Diapherotrites archaeon]|nr:PadR family transcriptional regulator [Candidatus Diapherotrites archaeon]